MDNVYDLHIEKEIFPLFNYTYNEFSKKILLQLLTDRPSCLENIFYRQAILKACDKNWSILDSFSYSRLDLNEVYQYFEEISKQNHTTQHSKLKLLLSPKIKQQSNARLSQLISLFYRLNSFYFSRLDVSFFPDDFQKKIYSILQFLLSFNLEKYNALIRRKGLTIKDILTLISLINNKIKTGEISTFWKEFFVFEAYISIATGIKKNHFTFAEFSDNIFSLTEFYHPLLKNAVCNSLTCKENVVLLTGPNMAGKSTLIKAVSLCVYLGHLGVGVPAAKCIIPFFDNISVAINTNDDIKSGYSQFMSEVINLKQIAFQLKNASRCFAAFDELFRGTNIDDALEISKTTIKGLSKFDRSLFFISTHLYQLKDTKEIKENKIANYYIDCVINNNKPIFSYQLKSGWSDLKIGKLLFENEGLDKLFS